MSALGDVIARIRGVVSTCGQARADLDQAAELLDEANVHYSEATASTRDPSANEALDLLARSAAQLDDALRAAVALRDRVRGYLAGLTGTGRAQPTNAATPRDLIDQLRAELPPPVVPRTGQKTHGRWIGPDGEARVMISGRDAAYDETIQVFKDMKSRHIPQRASDVEMKLAAHMRKNGVRSATLIINYTPCGGPMSCDALVPVILPKGYTLTVYGTNGFKREYSGGGTSSWVP